MLVELDENGMNIHAKKTGDDFNLHDRVNDAYYGKLGESFKAKTRKRIDWIVEQVQGKTALDVGCSQGIVPILLARKGLSVLGIDIDNKVVVNANAAKKNEPQSVQKNLKFIKNDFLKSNLDGRKYDTIIFSEFLEHLYEPELFIKRASELTSINGRLIITVPFGINDHPDHRQNFYLLELYEMLSKYYDIDQVIIIEKWIGFTVVKRSRVKSPQLPGRKEILRSEEAFYRIERLLIDRTEALKLQLAKLKQSNSELETYKTNSSLLKNDAKKYREQRNALLGSQSYKIGRAILYPARRLYDIKLIRKILLFAYYFIFPHKKEILSNNKIPYGSLYGSPSAKKFVVKSSIKASLKNLRVAAVMDEFTHSSYKYECKIEQLAPDSWKSQIAKFSPDLLFIESAWRGQDGLWREKVSRGPEHVLKVIKHCQQRGIPTVFWNKEDPAHTAVFLPIASMVDFVFTTDSDCVPIYRDVLCHDRVFVLPFAAQPRIHNPIEEYERRDAFNFAGSYYAKYKERSQNFLSLVEGITKYKKIDIYDRNSWLGLGPTYQFPENLKNYVKDSLPYSEINKAYKGYNYALNINTIKHSPTMFARRAFELLACNTVTVSNFATGIKNILGDLVIATDDGEKASKKLSKVIESSTTVNRFKLQGLRAVMQNHTYEDRLGYLCEKVFVNFIYRPIQPVVVVIARATTKHSLERIVEMYDNQLYESKELIIFTDVEEAKQKRSDIQLLSKVDEKLILKKIIVDAQYVSVFAEDSYYGPNYLLDLTLATKYSDAAIIGKSTFYMCNPKLLLKADGRQYHVEQPLQLKRSLADFTKFSDKKVTLLLSEKEYSNNTFSVDEFSYCELKGRRLPSSAKKTVDALSDIDMGKSLEAIYREAESVAKDRKKLMISKLQRALRLRRTKVFVSDL